MATVTNVCFHGVGTPRRDLEPGEADYWIGRDAFLGILDELAGRPGVRISFDDGNASDVEIALPALVERGMTATFFLLAGRLDDAGSVHRDRVRALAAGGMPIGSHGMDHRSWRGLTADESRVELGEARDVLSEVSGTQVVEAALPLGRYDRGVLSELRRRGYDRVYTSDQTEARPDAWLQPRFSVRRHDTAATVHERILRARPFVQRAERRVAQLVKSLR